MDSFRDTKARRQHDDIDTAWRNDLFEVYIVAAGETERVSRLKTRLDMVFIDVWHDFVGHENKQNIGAPCRLKQRNRFKPVGSGFFRRCIGARPDNHIHARIPHVESLRATLIAVSEHSDHFV